MVNAGEARRGIVAPGQLAVAARGLLGEAALRRCDGRGVSWEDTERGGPAGPAPLRVGAYCARCRDAIARRFGWRAERMRAGLDAVCPRPDPLATEAGHARYTHADLAALSGPALRLEAERVRLRLLLDAEPDPWFVAHHAAIAEEERRRG